LRGFSLSEKDNYSHSHHWITRQPGIAEQVIKKVRAAEDMNSGGNVARLGLWDITCGEPSEPGSVGKTPDQGETRRCEWLEVPTGNTQSTTWPFYFEGYDQGFILHRPDPSAARFHVVRLHMSTGHSAPSFDRQGTPQGRSVAEMAITEVARGFGVDSRAVELYEDAGVWFLLDAAGGRRDVEYIGEVLLVDRGPDADPAPGVQATPPPY